MRALLVMLPLRIPLLLIAVFAAVVGIPASRSCAQEKEAIDAAVLFEQACLSDRTGVSYGTVLAALARDASSAIPVPERAVILELCQLFLGKGDPSFLLPETVDIREPAPTRRLVKPRRLREGQMRLARLVAQKRERQKRVLTESIERWRQEETLTPDVVGKIRKGLFEKLNNDGVVPTDDQIEDMIVRLLMEDLLK